MRTVVLGLLLAGSAPCGLAACGAKADVEARRPRTHIPWVDCYRSFTPSGDAAGDLAKLGAACAAPAGLVALTSAIEGAKQSAEDASARLAFRAPPGGCYRVFAIGEAGVRDLDVAVYGPDRRLVAGDAGEDRWPIVPPRGPLCVEEGGLYTVEVAVAAGSGGYRVQIWGTPDR